MDSNHHKSISFFSNRDISIGLILQIIDQNKTSVLIDFDRMITSNHGLFSCEFTMYYSAPEINSDNATSKCDIYSLGQIIYFIMKCKNPVKNEIFLD